MDSRTHWDGIHATKARDAVSWYTPHLARSLTLIEKLAGSRTSSIIDVGGGQSTLVDDLLGLGYSNITVLDIAPSAIEASKVRIGDKAQAVQWIAADITKCEFEPAGFDLWHDRAVFHFLTDAADRGSYVRQVSRAVKPGSHVIISTFAKEGPTRCSGLDVVRYDADSLLEALGTEFTLLGSSSESHHTPFGTTQEFLYCWFRFDPEAGRV
jgi:2-polyprenyl-3-methyl-5-hydroxy-6-metoxy-1,4-benzoquinol methylase